MAKDSQRTNIELDNKLIKEAIRLTGIRTKKGVVTKGLQILVDLAKQEQIRSLRGKLSWTGDLGNLRNNKK